ncbi:MAG: phenylalanine--tRNA ligase subunit beta [Candidatus Thorarchaeota archaeon]
MIVDVNIGRLLRLLGGQVKIDQIEDALFLLKCESERLDDNTLAVEVNPDRQDMLSTEGISRALRAFMGLGVVPARYQVRSSGKEVIVTRGLEKIRPFIACGVVRDIEISDEIIRDYMRLQERLTDTHGRNRRKASIGLYVFDQIVFPVTYSVSRPERIRFVPLGHEAPMSGPEILEKHDKGQLYGHIISGFSKWPILTDAEGKTLSLPPIINSNDIGRVTEDDRDIFVEVTGTHLQTVFQALNIMMTSFAEVGGRLESVKVLYPSGDVHETPQLEPQRRKISTARINELTGLGLTDEETVRCLSRMCYGAQVTEQGVVSLEVPAYRTDIMHDVDVIEDVAIGYGFDRIEPSFPSTMTSGKLLPRTRLKNKVRDLMVGCSYQEIMNYIMTSPDVLNARMNRATPMISVANPKSSEYCVLRNALLPVLLDFASRNQHAGYPQRLFEVGDIVIPDSSKETRSLQVPSVSGLTIDDRVNLTQMMSEIAFVLRNLGLDGRFKFRASPHASFIEGRSGTIIVDDDEVGLFGELDPDVLTKFGIARPAVAFEIQLPHAGTW